MDIQTATMRMWRIRSCECETPECVRWCPWVWMRALAPGCVRWRSRECALWRVCERSFFPVYRCERALDCVRMGCKCDVQRTRHKLSSWQISFLYSSPSPPSILLYAAIPSTCEYLSCRYPAVRVCRLLRNISLCGFSFARRAAAAVFPAPILARGTLRRHRIASGVCNLNSTGCCTHPNDRVWPVHGVIPCACPCH
jgi:hypothetical protein